jgi:hypothetical protein
MPALLDLVSRARHTLVLDLPFPADSESPVVSELVAALTSRMAAVPDLWVLIVTGPRSSAHAQVCPPALVPVVRAGGHVVIADLDQVPDSNRVFSPWYRLASPILSRLPVRDAAGSVAADPDLAPGRSLAQRLRSWNAKGNRRGLAASRDAAGRWEFLCGAFPLSEAEGSDLHAVLRVHGPLLTEALLAEYEIARSSLLRSRRWCFSATDHYGVLRQLEARISALEQTEPGLDDEDEGDGRVQVQYFGEEALGERVSWLLLDAGADTQVEACLSSLSSAEFEQGLRRAAGRGARVRLLLNPAEADGAGPACDTGANRVVGTSLARWAAEEGVDLEVRWLVRAAGVPRANVLRVHNPRLGDDRILVMSGGATGKNLTGRNLCCGVLVRRGGEIGDVFSELFSELWENPREVVYSLGCDQLALSGVEFVSARLRVLLSRLTGWSLY